MLCSFPIVAEQPDIMDILRVMTCDITSMTCVCIELTLGAKMFLERQKVLSHNSVFGNGT